MRMKGDPVPMKKTVAVLLSLVMILTLTCALAAVPSKTSDNIAKVGTLVADGDPSKDLKGLSIIITESEKVDETLAELIEAVKDNAPAAFFPEDVQAKIAESLPEGVTPADLELNEFAALDVIGFEPDTYSVVTAPFTFDTAYAQDQKVFPVVGVYGDDTISWVNLPEAEVGEDGSITLAFDDAQLAAMDPAPALALAVLSTPAE